MKHLPTIKAIIFSLFLLFIYWDSTLWKTAINYLGVGEKRVIYGLFSIGLLLGIAMIYFISFKLLASFSKNKGRDIPQPSNVIYYILIIIFCFKFLVFGDIGLRINRQSTIEVCHSSVTSSNDDCAIEIKSPVIRDSSLIIYKVGSSKGDHSWKDLYQGLYFLKDIETQKHYVVRSGIVSGSVIESDIKDEVLTKSDGLLLIKDLDIKTSQKDEVNDFLKTNSLSYETPIFSIQLDGFQIFFLLLLYWGVYVLVLIFIFFLIVLSFPDKN